MLLGTRQLVEQSCLSAVLIAHQRERQLCSVRKRIAAALRVKDAFLAQTGVHCLFLCSFLGSDAWRDGFHGYLSGVGKAEREFIAVDAQFDGIAHRCELHHGDFRAGDHAHIQKVLSEGAFAADTFYGG